MIANGHTHTMPHTLKDIDEAAARHCNCLYAVPTHCVLAKASLNRKIRGQLVYLPCVAQFSNLQIITGPSFCE